MGQKRIIRSEPKEIVLQEQQSQIERLQRKLEEAERSGFTEATEADILVLAKEGNVNYGFGRELPST